MCDKNHLGNFLYENFVQKFGYCAKWEKCIKKIMYPALLGGISSSASGFQATYIWSLLDNWDAKKSLVCLSVDKSLKKHDRLVAIPRILMRCMFFSLLLHLILLWNTLEIVWSHSGGDSPKSLLLVSLIPNFESLNLNR